MADVRRRAEAADDAFKLKAFTVGGKEQTREEWLKLNREMVTLPDPYDIIMMFKRLIGGEMDIEIMAEEETSAAKMLSDRREQYAQGLIYRLRREQRRNLRSELAFWGGVRGRFVIDVRWIGNDMKKEEMKHRLPLLVRTLDPLNVLVRWGSFGASYAIHKYQTTVIDVRERWGDKAAEALGDKDDHQLVTIYDYWDKEQNAVTCDGEPIVPPTDHNYEGLPFIFGGADDTPLDDEEFRWVSPLTPIIPLWLYKCRLASQIATGMTYEFWPAWLVFDPHNLITTLDRSPGGYTEISGTPDQVEGRALSGKPNMPIAESLYQLVGGAIDKSTFPSVLYGQQPGQVTAGYAISNLSSAARGRIGPLKESIELCLADAVELMFRLIRKFGPTGGVPVWVMAETENVKKGMLQLKKKELAQDMPIVVSIMPDIPQDDMANKTLALQMVKEGIISKETFGQDYANVKYPQRERRRWLLEQALQNPQVMQQYMAEAYQAHEGKPL